MVDGCHEAFAAPVDVGQLDGHAWIQGAVLARSAQQAFHDRLHMEKEPAFVLGKLADFATRQPLHDRHLPQPANCSLAGISTSATARTNDRRREGPIFWATNGPCRSRAAGPRSTFCNSRSAMARNASSDGVSPRLGCRASMAACT